MVIKKYENEKSLIKGACTVRNCAEPPSTFERDPSSESLLAKQPHPDPGLIYFKSKASTDMSNMTPQNIVISRGEIQFRMDDLGLGISKKLKSL